MRRENDKFHSMCVFHEVVTQGSFTKAAESLDMTISSVSKAVNQLETSLNVKLLHRTTRTQSLTDSGQLYMGYAGQLLNQFKEMEQLVQQQDAEPTGVLKVAIPTALGQFFLSPRLHEFMKAFPKIKVELTLSEAIVDIASQGFDLAIQSVALPTRSSLYSAQIGSHKQRLVATPEYLEQHEKIGSPEQLHSLDLLSYKGPQISTTWSFNKDEELTQLIPEPIFTSNNYYSLLQAAKNGMGVANLYQYMVDDEIAKGNLVELLPDWQQASRDRYAIYQQRRDSSVKLDVFIKFLTALFD